MAILSPLFLKVFHKGELAVFDIQEWIIFQNQKFFLKDGKKGYHGEDGNKNTLSSTTSLSYSKYLLEHIKCYSLLTVTKRSKIG